MATTTNQDGMDFPNLEAKLDEPDSIIKTDPSEIVENNDKPAYSKKSGRKSKLDKLDPTSIKLSQIASEIKKGFPTIEIKQLAFDSAILNPQKQRTLALANISRTIADDKIIFKTWGQKLKSIYPSDVYGDTKHVDSSDPLHRHKEIVGILDKQRKIAIDQAVRLRTQAILQNRMFIAAHSDNISILQNVALNTQRINVFLDEHVKKYMMKSLELKFKHIFVSQDILKHTKVMIDTMASKLESVKHNTSLSEVAKTSFLGEFKRNLRIRTSNTVADAIFDPVRGTIKEVIGNLTSKITKELTSQYQRYTGSSPIEYDEADTDTLRSKSRRLSRKVRGDIGFSDRSFSDANMGKVSDKGNQSDISKSIDAALNVIKSKKPEESSSIRSLLKTSDEQATFDRLTRRSIVDIIPSLLAKIHQQTTITSKILSFKTRMDIGEHRAKDFDKAIKTEEIRFDKSSEKFVERSELDKKLVDNIFGDREERTNILTPIIRSFHKGYTKHGGDTSDFRQMLPTIVSFITNISKHARVVKIGHIQKYLEGKVLSDFEQKYLDAVFVDIKDDEKRRLAKILASTFFKDEQMQEIDTDVSEDIGAQIRDLVKYRKQELERVNTVAKYGDLENASFVSKTGEYDHKKLRDIYSDVDTSRLGTQLEMPEEEKFDLRQAMAERVRRAKEFGAKTVSAANLRRKEGKEPPPTRDAIQISGPGEYVQGSKREFHIPFDKISDQVRTQIEKLIGKQNIKGFAESKAEKAKEVKDSVFERMNDILTQISILNEESVNALHGIIFKMSDDGDRSFKFKPSEIYLNAKASAKERLGKLKSHSKGFGSKLYDKLFRRNKQVGQPIDQSQLRHPFVEGMSGFGSKLGKVGSGIGKFAKGGFDVMSKILPFMASMYFAPYILGAQFAWKGGKGLAKLGKKFFTENKFVDIYRKDEVKPGEPLLKGDDIKQGKYVLSSGKQLKDSFSIDSPILDHEGKTIISQDDIDHGLVDVNNKPLILKGSLALRAGKAVVKGVGFGLKASGAVLKGAFELHKFILTKLFSAIPGIAGFFTKKKKKDTELLTNVSVEELITKHLVEIKDLLKPISNQFTALREGSYADYKRDRAEESGKKRQRFNPVRDRNSGKSDVRKGAAALGGGGVLSTIGSLFGMGGGDGEGSGALGTAAQIGIGGYALKKAKDIGGRLFGKKSAEAAADVAGSTAKKAAKEGILKRTIGNLGKSKLGIKEGFSKVAGSKFAQGAAKGMTKMFGGTKGTVLTAILGALGANYFMGDTAEAAVKKTSGQLGEEAIEGTAKGAAKDSLGKSIAKEVGISLAADKGIELVKKLYAKKAAGATTGAILRSSMAALGRFGAAQAFRTVAISGATALIGAASSPIVLGGLAVAGLGAGGYALWKWGSGNSRRKMITKIRNAIYKVPEDKLSALVDFENEVAAATTGQDDSLRLMKNMKDHIKEFGLDPDDKRQFTFFKHWYATMFFPMLKGSVDIIEQNFKIKFKDQEKLDDNQLNEYKKIVEDSSLYKELIGTSFDLSKKGFTIWQKEKFFNDKDLRSADDIQKDLDAKLEETAKLIDDGKSLSRMKHEDVQEKNQEKQDDIFDGYGVPGIMPEFNLPTKTPKVAALPKSDEKEKTLEEYARSYGKGGNDPVLNSKGKTDKSKTWKKVERRIVEQLIRLGWKKNQAIGIAANLYYESSGDHTVGGDNGAAYGLAQWQGPRQRLFAKKFGKDIRQASFEEQVAFIDYELRHGDTLERKAGQLLMQSDDPEEAARIVSKYYERPSDKEGEPPKRARFAKLMSKHYEGEDDNSILSKADQNSLNAADAENQKEDSTVSKKTLDAVDPDLKLGKRNIPGAPSSSDDAAFAGYGMPEITIPESSGKTTPGAKGGGGFGGFMKSLNPFSSDTKSSSGGGGGESDDEAGDTTISASDDIGSAVAKYESGSKGVASISGGAGDPGGASYGKYQLASKTGTLGRYLKDSGYDKQFAGLAPGSAGFNAKWTELAKSDKAFADSQHDFIKKTHFDPAIKIAKELGFDVNNRAIQEMIWSGSIQHGKVSKVLQNAAATPGFAQMDAKQQVAAFYQARNAYAESAMRKNGASEAVIQGVAKRYRSEIKDVMKLADASPDNVAKQDPSIPSPVLNQQPIDNKPMGDIQAKDIKEGLPKSNDVAGDVPKAVTATPAPDGGKPIVTTAPAVPNPVASKPMTDQERIDAHVKSAMSGIDDITSGKRAFKDKLREDKIKQGIPSDVAAREAREEADRKFGLPPTPVETTAKFASTVPVTQAAPIQQITPPTPQTKTKTDGTPEITINDPEAKTQTSLLEQQNQLLAQIAQKIGSPSTTPESTTEGKTNDDAVVKKLDEVIRAIASNVQSTTTSQSSSTKGTPTRTVNQPTSPGIDVKRQVVQ